MASVQQLNDLSEKMGFATKVGTEPRRHWLVAMYLQMGMRLYFYFQSWLGLKAFVLGFTAYPSNWRPKKCPTYDWVTTCGFLLVWLIAGVARDSGVGFLLLRYSGMMHLLKAFHEFLMARLQRKIEESGFTSAEREIPIPEYDWKNGDPETFYKTFVKRPHPVILRGFMKDEALLKELSWDAVLGKYGDEDVFLTKKELDGYPGKLREVDNPRVYLHNSEKIFNKYPEIRKLFQYQRLEPYLHQKVGYEQIFVGRSGTGTPFHHASVYNMFYQITGRKHWWFIDPYDTILGYPMAVAGKAANAMLTLWPDEYNEEALPLFKYCPVYEATLNPGDVLFNPPWWWHAIKNIDEKTVGVASRWHTDGICGQNFVATEEDYDVYRVGSLLFFSGWASVGFLHGILQTPSPRYDEHLTLRETRNRFVHLQRVAADAGGVDVMGMKTKF